MLENSVDIHWDSDAAYFLPSYIISLQGKEGSGTGLEFMLVAILTAQTPSAV
jgi:hypothetical protein